MAKPSRVVVLSLALCAAAVFGIVAFLTVRPARVSELPPQSPIRTGAPVPALNYVSQAIGAPISGRPWITHVAIVDLDQDGLPDVLVCDASPDTNTVSWIRQAPRGVFTEHVLGDKIPGPVHVEVCDIDGDGDLDLLVASMGLIFPNNDLLGSVVVIENLGDGTWRNRVLLEGVARVTDVRGADLDGDGDIDLVVGQFGYDQGEIRWLENKGNWHFQSHRLLGLSGTIHTPVADFDGDNRPAIAALVSQEWEEIHLFRNRGGGDLRGAVIWGSTNEDYGSSGLTVADLDGDGDPDMVLTNGDAFDYTRPGPRPWHGIQWLENRGGAFTYHRIGNMAGAYSPVVIDLDGDGHQDIVAVSCFNKWEDPASVSMQAWINDGRQNFRPVVLARRPTHLVTVAAGDLDGDGVPELVTGGFHAYPPWDSMSRVLVWKRE